MLVREPIFINRRTVNYNPQRTEERAYRLPVDAYVTEEEIVLTASVPGMHPEGLHITLEDDTLIIQGELNGLKEDARYILRERTHGKFERRLTINVPVDVNAAEASFEHGVLTLVLPKAPEAKPRRITVKAID